MTPNIKPRQTERLRFIDFCANFLGAIGRVDIVSRFGISDAAASKDIAEYIKMAPKNLTYEFKTKTHIPTKQFKALFKFPTNQVLKTLSTGIGDAHGISATPLLPSEIALELNNPDLDVLAQITRAINLKKIVDITYWFRDIGERDGQLAPFALIDSGLKWHVRAYDRIKDEFRNFILTRIKKAKLTDLEARKEELSEFDESWNKKIKLILVPHPDNAKRPDEIIMDFNTMDGELEIELRQAIAGYVLCHLNVDCTPDHRLKGDQYQFWLKNRYSVDGIENMVQAPGIDGKL